MESPNTMTAGNLGAPLLAGAVAEDFPERNNIEIESSRETVMRVPIAVEE